MTEERIQEKSNANTTARSTTKSAKPKDVPVPDLTGRADQIGAIIVKTLDLAEAGLSLGITILTRAGAVAQDALAERVSAETVEGPPSESSQPSAVDGSRAPESQFFLANQVPLAPGGTVHVSFSITNDSLVEAKRVSLQVGDFVGEAHEVRIDSGAFAVRPARKTIAPMDFDKFVLTGTLPAAAPPDVYRGTVTVSSTDQLTIPVRLLVAVS